MSLFNKENNCQTYLKSVLNTMKIKSIIIKKEDKIKRGFILSNHRCWIDFIIDNYITQFI